MVESFLFYTVKVIFAQIVFLVIYFLTFKQKPNFNANRFYLIFSVVLSYILPLISFNLFQESTAAFSVITETITISANKIAQINTSSSFSAISYIYVLVSIFILIANIFAIIKISKLIKSGKRLNSDKEKIVFLDNNQTPFSFFNYIFLPGQNLTAENQYILTHERGHVSMLHSIDLLTLHLLQTFHWINPLLYVFQKELVLVHEYQADDYVLKSGVNPQKYGNLLYEISFVKQSYSVSNYFNQSLLKRRFIMMTKQKSNKNKFLYPIAGLLAIPALMFVYSCTDEGIELKEESVQNKTEKVVKSTEESTEFSLTEKAFELKDVEQAPVYEGGQQALINYLSTNIKYPEKAKEQAIQGKVFVRMVVDKDGKVTGVRVLKSVHELLDAEAVRVVSAMPDWTPGMKDGKPVKVEYTIPINFRLN